MHFVTARKKQHLFLANIFQGIFWREKIVAQKDAIFATFEVQPINHELWRRRAEIALNLCPENHNIVFYRIRFMISWDHVPQKCRIFFFCFFRTLTTHGVINGRADGTAFLHRMKKIRCFCTNKSPSFFLSFFASCNHKL